MVCSSYGGSFVKQAHDWVLQGMVRACVTQSLSFGVYLGSGLYLAAGEELVETCLLVSCMTLD